MAHLCQHNAPANTPLATVYLKGRKHIIRSDKITAAICALIPALPKFGFAKTDVSAHSFRAGGAMALLLRGSTWTPPV